MCQGHDKLLLYIGVLHQITTNYCDASIGIIIGSAIAFTVKSLSLNWQVFTSCNTRCIMTTNLQQYLLLVLL